MRSLLLINIIEYLTTEKNTPQKTIAKDLSVTPAQVSRWKKGDDKIPDERFKQLLEMTGLNCGEEFADDLGQSFVNDLFQWALIIQESGEEAWVDYLNGEHLMHDDDCYNGEDNPIHPDEPHKLPLILITLMEEFDIEIPKRVPQRAWTDEAGHPTEVLEDQQFQIYCDDFTNLLGAVYNNTRYIDNYIAAFIFDDWIEIDAPHLEIEAHITHLALASVHLAHFEAMGVSPDKVATYRRKTRGMMAGFIHDGCLEMLESNTPIKTNYFDLAYKDAGVLDDMAETCAAGNYHVKEGHIARHVDDYLSSFERRLMGKVDALEQMVKQLVQQQGPTEVR